MVVSSSRLTPKIVESLAEVGEPGPWSKQMGNGIVRDQHAERLVSKVVGETTTARSHRGAEIVAEASVPLLRKVDETGNEIVLGQHVGQLVSKVGVVASSRMSQVKKTHLVGKGVVLDWQCD